jgi:ABC-type branched-subunit amino acid transport system substrate-binding protein
MLGVLVPFTGALSSFGPDYENAAKLAAKCLNNAGGVNGGPVKIVAGDTGTASENAVAVADRLVSVANVVAILGGASDEVTLAVAESVTIPKGILQITPASTSPALSSVLDDDFLFRMPASDAVQGVVLADVLFEDLGYRFVCDLYVDDVYGKGLSDQYVATFTDLGGTVTASVSHDDLQAVSYRTQLEQCTEGDPEALVAISYASGQATVYLAEALEVGLIDQFAFVDLTKDDAIFAEVGWDKFDGMVGTAPGVLTTALGEAYDEAHAAEYGAPYRVPFVREAYDAVMLVGLAAAAAGTNIDSAAIRDSLRSVSNPPGTVYGSGEADVIAAVAAADRGDDIDYQGASGPTDFDENGDITFGAVEVWQVDASNELLTTIGRFSVDLVTGEIVELTDSIR